MENLEIVQESPTIQRRGRGRPRIYPAKEIDPDMPKRGRGRPRVYPAKEVGPDEPKKGRGRPRIHPLKEFNPDKPKRNKYNKPGLSRSEHNKLYRLRHPEVNTKYSKKIIMCDICEKAYLSRNIELHNNNSLHLANLYKKMQVSSEV